MSFLSRSLAFLALATLPQVGSAQTNATFVLDQANSNFTWTGSSTLGPIVGNPSNQFQLLGTQNMGLTFQAGAQPFASGAFALGGSVTTNGPIHGKVTGAFGITLATIDVNNLSMNATSPSFTLGAGGAFTATLTLNTLSGQLVVTPLIGSQTTTDLTGSTSAPTAVSGTMTVVGSNFHLVGPVNSTFPFSDPGSGASGTFTLTGTLTADYPFMKTFCVGDGSGVACPCGNNSPVGQGRGCVHSAGLGARLVTSGMPSLSGDTLVLTGSSQPAGTLGLFFQGTAAAGTGQGVAFGDGILCVGGTIVRLGVKAAPAGTSSYPIAGDPSVSVQGLVAAPGVRTYQLWYRDALTYCTASTFNLTNGAEVLWLP